MLCKCGCGQTVTPGRTWVRGHHHRGKTFSEQHKRNMSKAQIKRHKTNPTQIKNRTTIDWDEIIEAYNNKYETCFTTEKEMFQALYPKLTPRKLEKILGVNRMTIYSRLDYYGIKRNHRRGGNNAKRKPGWELFLSIPKSLIEKTPTKELASSLNVDPSTIYRWIKEAKKDIKLKNTKPKRS